MPKSFSNLTFTESAHIGLDDDTPEVPLKVKRDVDIALDDNIRGVTIDYNVSGSTAQSGDHFYEALHIDVDSSATGGDTNQETRLVGIKCNVTDSGDSNDIYGGYFDARASKTTANDTISQVNGVYTLVKTTHTAGEVKNLYGVNALVQTDNASSGTDLTSIRGVQGVVQQTGDSGKVVANAYGGHFKVDLAASSNDGTFTNCDGVYGEIEIDDADITVSSARAVKGVIDSNGGTITSAYQFFGTTSTSGTITNSWGIYLQNCAKNYIQGTLRLPSYGAGTLVTDSDGNITAGSALSSFLPLAGGTMTGDITTGSDILLTGSANIQHAASGGLFDLNENSDKVKLQTNHPQILFQIDNDHTEPDTEIFQINISTASPAPLKLTTSGLSLNPISNATSDTDKFLVSDSGTIKYRTGDEVRSDIGAGTGNVTTSSGSSTGVAFFDSSTNLTTTNKFIFDDTNKRLSVNGGTSPSHTLTLGGNGIQCTSSTAEIDLEANGDIKMGTSSTFQVDGDAGTSGKYLESTGSGLQWSTPSTSQTILISNFDDATNTTSYQNIPFNYIFESATQSYYHVFACPAAGTVKRITFMHVHGSMTIGQGSTTTQLQVVKNGSIADTSGELTADGGSADGSKIVYEPGTSFANGDRLQFQFSRSQSNLYWRGVAVSIVLEFTHV